MDDEAWIENHTALQDGARLQALDAKRTYEAVLRWLPKKHTATRYQETIKGTKDKVEEATGLRPTTERLLKSFRALGVPPRLKDHMRCLINKE